MLCHGSIQLLLLLYWKRKCLRESPDAQGFQSETFRPVDHVEHDMKHIVVRQNVVRKANLSVVTRDDMMTEKNTMHLD